MNAAACGDGFDRFCNDLLGFIRANFDLRGGGWLLCAALGDGIEHGGAGFDQRQASEVGRAKAQSLGLASDLLGLGADGVGGGGGGRRRLRLGGDGVGHGGAFLFFRRRGRGD